MRHVIMQGLQRLEPMSGAMPLHAALSG